MKAYPIKYIKNIKNKKASLMSLALAIGAGEVVVKSGERTLSLDDIKKISNDELFDCDILVNNDRLFLARDNLAYSGGKYYGQRKGVDYAFGIKKEPDFPSIVVLEKFYGMIANR